MDEYVREYIEQVQRDTCYADIEPIAREQLRREDLVLYEWQESDAGPPRKYYRLTEAGKAQLAALDDYWNLINRTIADLGT